ncbi:hypothetical protein ACWDTQ_33570 [Streptomyces cellulosae]
MRRAIDWFRGLSEGGKVVVVAALVTAIGGGFFTLAAASIPILLGDDDKPSAQAPTTAPGPAAPSTPPDRSSAPTPSTTTSVPTTPTYELDYENQTMSIGLPSDSEVAGLDFDAPGTRRYTKTEWEALETSAEETGSPVQPDLYYDDPVRGFLGLPNGRNAAQLQAADAPSKVEDCARQAQVGGFTEAKMSDWSIAPKTVLCVVTDQGNIVKAQLIRFVGAAPNPWEFAKSPPEQIEFKVTMWRKSG